MAHVFALDERHAVRYFPFTTSAPWTVPPAGGLPGTNLGGELTGPPAAQVQGDRIHVVGRGLDGAFWDNRSRDAGHNWTGWRRLGGDWRSMPSITVVSGSPGRTMIVGLGQDATTWALISNDGGESFTLARYAQGALAQQPVAATDWRGEQAVVYASFPDTLKIGRGGQWAATGTRWPGDPVPVLASEPVAISNGMMENILGRDSNGHLWMYAYESTGGRGGGGVAQGSSIIGKPAVAYQSFDGLDYHVIIVARSPDHKLWISRVDPGTTGAGVAFRPLDVSATSDPAVIGCFQSPMCLVFAQDGSQLLYGIVGT